MLSVTTHTELNRHRLSQGHAVDHCRMITQIIQHITVEYKIVFIRDIAVKTFYLTLSHYCCSLSKTLEVGGVRTAVR